MARRLQRGLFTLALLCGIAPFAIAQERVQLHGVLERSNTTRDYTLECSIVDLFAQFDLEPFVGSHVDIIGVNVGDAGAPRILVQAIEQSEPVLEIAGSGRIGTGLTFTVRGEPGQEAFLFLDDAPGYLPVFGQAFLLGEALPPFFMGRIPSSGELVFRLIIPSMGQLIGKEFFAQAVLRGNSGTAFELSGPDCFTITQ